MRSKILLHFREWNSKHRIYAPRDFREKRKQASRWENSFFPEAIRYVDSFLEKTNRRFHRSSPVDHVFRSSGGRSSSVCTAEGGGGGATAARQISDKSVVANVFSALGVWALRRTEKRDEHRFGPPVPDRSHRIKRLLGSFPPLLFTVGEADIPLFPPPSSTFWSIAPSHGKLLG